MCNAKGNLKALSIPSNSQIQEHNTSVTWILGEYAFFGINKQCRSSLLTYTWTLLVHKEMYGFFKFVSKTIKVPDEQKEAQEIYMFKFFTLSKTNISSELNNWAKFHENPSNNVGDIDTKDKQTFDLQAWPWPRVKLAYLCLLHIISVTGTFEPSFMKILKKMWEIWCWHEKLTQTFALQVWPWLKKAF